MLERDIESWAKKKARASDWYVRKFKTPAHRSAPDDIFISDGRVFFVEFKATGVLATDLQMIEHEKLRAAGATVYVCDSRARFDEILRKETATIICARLERRDV